jgi:hypothetical protein
VDFQTHRNKNQAGRNKNQIRRSKNQMGLSGKTSIFQMDATDGVTVAELTPLRQPQRSKNHALSVLAGGKWTNSGLIRRADRA